MQQLQERILDKQRSYDGLFGEKTELMSKVDALEEESVRLEREINILKHEVIKLFWFHRVKTDFIPTLSTFLERTV